MDRQKRPLLPVFFALTSALAVIAGPGLLGDAVDDVEGRLERRHYPITLQRRAGHEKTQQGRSSCLALDPVELGCIPGELHKPDALLDVVLIRLFMPLDAGADLGLFVAPLRRCQEITGQITRMAI